MDEDTLYYVAVADLTHLYMESTQDASEALEWLQGYAESDDARPFRAFVMKGQGMALNDAIAELKRLSSEK